MKNAIDVAIVMGSDSDLPVLADAAMTLDEFGIPYDIQVLSAHRTPRALAVYLDLAVERGVSVIIAAAGGAAHLPGVIAAHVTLPVIGVPIKTPTLGGVDSLYSIVQMPPGVPVATVGINSAKNAALLAIQMLGIADPALHKSWKKYKRKLADQVQTKNDHLQKIGYKKYLEEKMKG